MVMALSQHHVSKRTSTRRLGIRSPQQLVMLVTATLLHIKIGAAFSHHAPVEERVLSSTPMTSASVSQSESIMPTSTTLHQSLQSHVTVLNSESTESGSKISLRKTKECTRRNETQVLVREDCRVLLLNLKIPEELIPRDETLLYSTNYSMVNVSLSVGSVSSIISEDYECNRRIARKHIDVANNICILLINYGNILQSSDEFESNQFTNTLSSITGISCIKALSLRNNNIYGLDENVFTDFVNLKVLDLSENELLILNVTQAQFPFLIKLKISRNKLQWIDGSPHNLTSLYIDHNNITDLSFISKFENISIINASHNSIANIPPSISKLKGLICIVLDSNKIKDISILQNFSLKNLYRISLSHNEIQQVNVDLTKHKLKLLELNHNNISYFNFTGVKYLSHLDLCNNHISEISPPHPLRESDINSLKLCDNSLRNATVIMLMKNLVSLDLSNNNLQNLDKMFVNKMFLRELRLSNVNLQSLDFVKDLEKLEILQVDHNNITHFPKKLFPKNLKTFNLSNNPLKPMYCPSNEIGKHIIDECKIPFDKEQNNIILNIKIKDNEFNNKMKCVFDSPSGKDFLNLCSSSSSKKEALKRLLLNMAILFILNVF